MNELGELPQDLMSKINEASSLQEAMDKIDLYDADPKCKHHVVTLQSGVKCTKCRGWFCY